MKNFKETIAPSMGQKINHATVTEKTVKDFRAARLEHRNALIRELFYQLTNHENFRFMTAYVFLEKIFGIDERQIRKILRQNSKVELSSADLSIFAVILQRLSEKTKERSKEK